MQSFRKFYKNKKVLVTGHTGFKGSWLTIWLKQLGAEVIGIALDPKTDKDLFLLAGISDKITDYRKDIRNLEKIKDILSNEKPEIVFHLAAQALVLPGYENPVSTFEINIMGTVNILEACRHTPSVKQIVIVTTDKVYENKETMTGYRETDPLGGFDPYSASKAAAEIVTQSYRLSFTQSSNQSINQSISTTRAGNVIGGGDWAEYRLVPDCIRALETDQPIIIRNPYALRPWQHVLEPLSGYLFLALKMAEDPEKYSGAWNFGPNEENNASVRDVVDMLISLWGNGEWKPKIKSGKLHEAGLLRLNINKSHDILGWYSVMDFREAVQWTAEWYKAYKKADAYKLCMDQIERYTAKWNSGHLK
ncbi:MAG: CDP-glucose 4,6-dehydratase [Bacteroidales bacterium]|nr:CDP-glucose 4,6-dehydratase [Bacteroidales bacterium]OQB59874.1 MAG: CDP-glucose 4,6-dehydratase [Bacteroidetes bacterium ADurb.Bin145]